MTFKPLGKNILVRRLPEPTQSAGGIVLVTTPGSSWECEIVSAGPRCLHVKPGDVGRVGATRSRPTPLEFEGENLFLINEADLIWVLA